MFVGSKYTTPKNISTYLRFTQISGRKFENSIQRCRLYLKITKIVLYIILVNTNVNFLHVIKFTK